MEKKLSALDAWQNFSDKLFNWKKGFLIDVIVVVFLLTLNSFYLYPFLGEVDKSNVFSAPLIPALSYLVKLVTGLELGRAVVLCLLFFLVLSPVSLYFFAVKIIGRRLAGILAAIVYSLPGEWFVTGRIKMAFLFGDGGHIAALTLIPAVAMLLLNFLRRGGFRSLIFGSLGLGLVALASPFGLLVGAMVMLVIAFSELLLGQGRLKILRLVFFLAFSIGFVAFWYNPGFVALVFKSQQGIAVSKTFFNLVPLSFVVVPVLGAFGFLLFEKRSHLQPLFIALGMVVLFSLIAFAGYVNTLFPSHPHRYYSELGLSVSFLLGVLAIGLSDYLKFKGKFYKVKLNPLARSLAQKTFWLSSLGIMGAMIAFSMKSVWQLPQGQVLGLWDEGVVTGGAWEIKQQTNLTSNIIGYLITFLTVSLVAFFGLRINQAGLFSGLTGLSSPQARSGERQSPGRDAEKKRREKKNEK